MVEKSGLKSLGLKSSWLKSLGLKSSWLKSLGLTGPELKLGVEKSKVEMSFNPMVPMVCINILFYASVIVEVHSIAKQMKVMLT